MPSSSVDLYGTAYGNFATRAVEEVRQATYGEDFGQSSWVTAEEYRRFLRMLGLRAREQILDVGCGSGGPALFLARETGCRVTGVDLSEAGIRAGEMLVQKLGMQAAVTFHRADVCEPLPFPAGQFDALVCLDVLCHLRDRGRLFKEWYRVLASGGRVLVTDPVVVTGSVSRDESAVRSSTGYFEFWPPGTNEGLLREAGFELEPTLDETENEAAVSQRWHDAREKRSLELTRLEGKETFTRLQRFLATVHQLCAERRLSRHVYVARKVAR
ncbi:MAG TPA: methyltransferase domain-containing protein [Planctomycetaceae bacterium]|jgi:SAM-dependent methyltransferase|nr:methyltransferase domain-containing protein [Planctomycetaceae bacterium]